MRFFPFVLLAAGVGLVFAEADTEAASETKSDADRHPAPYPPLYPSHPGGPFSTYPPPPQYPPPVYPPPSHPYPYQSYPPRPAYDLSPYAGEKCTTKEWSSETELCKPKVTQACENLDVTVKKVRHPYEMCRPAMIPKCGQENDIKSVRTCNSKVLTKRITLHATLYEQTMVVRCNTHYETKCRRPYGYKPQCYTTPVKNCFDAPHLTEVDMPIRVTVAEIKDDCFTQRVPQPKTVCWEERVQLCPTVPELHDKEQTLLQCGFVLSNNDCSTVKLTLPMEICFPEEKYYPYPGPQQRPYKQ